MDVTIVRIYHLSLEVIMQITFSLHILSWEDGFCLPPHLQSWQGGAEQESHWAGGSWRPLHRGEASFLLRLSPFLNKAAHNAVGTFPELLRPLPWEISTNTRKNNFKQWKSLYGFVPFLLLRASSFSNLSSPPVSEGHCPFLPLQCWSYTRQILKKLTLNQLLFP